MAEAFHKVANIAAVPPGQAKVFEVEGRRLAICNADGVFYAIDDLCTHDGGPLGEGELVDAQIECPRHGARFDVRTGKALCLPAVMPVATYKLEVRGQEVWIALPAGVSSV